jgi:hypothetical protein
VLGGVNLILSTAGKKKSVKLSCVKAFFFFLIALFDSDTTVVMCTWNECGVMKVLKSATFNTFTLPRRKPPKVDDFIRGILLTSNILLLSLEEDHIFHDS